jgi:two-component system response regulator FlrC
MACATGRILIVDDDAALLKVMNAYLCRLGYSVDACRGAEEALALVGADPSGYSLALVDLNMPGMGGQELAMRMLECHPSIRLVVVSGYPPGLSGVETVAGGRVTYLQKPFAPKELVDAVG